MKYYFPFVSKNTVQKIILGTICCGMTSCIENNKIRNIKDYENPTNPIDTMLALDVRTTPAGAHIIRTVDKEGNYKQLEPDYANNNVGLFIRENDTILVQGDRVIDILRHKRAAEKFVNGR